MCHHHRTIWKNDGGQALHDAFVDVNKITARGKDSNSSNDYTFAHDAVGNMTDDGEKYAYVYDTFCRLVTVKNWSTNAVVAEYKYNGLNQRICGHDDTDASGTVDSSAPWCRDVHDRRPRNLAAQTQLPMTGWFRVVC